MRRDQKTKASCTPEEWAEHLKKVREYRAANRESYRAREREYNSRPEVKARRKLRDANPDSVVRRAAHNRKEEVKARARERVQELKALDPDWQSKRNAKNRQYRTGFSPELIADLLILQSGRCAVCEREFGQRARIHADHCHSANVPRGLLCQTCNLAEGMLNRIGLTPRQFADRLTKYLASPPVEEIAQGHQGKP